MNKLTVVHLDGTKITDKQSFLKEIAEALEFPEGFGHNWDALEDCLRYLKKKYFIVWTNYVYLDSIAKGVELLEEYGYIISTGESQVNLRNNYFFEAILDMLEVPHTWYD